MCTVINKPLEKADKGEKTMKKILTLIVTAVLSIGCIFGLTACGSGRTLEDVKNSKQLIISTEATFAPFESKEGENYVGIDIDIAQKIADYLGVKLVVKDMAFDSVCTAVQKGQVDLAIAGLTISDDRKEIIDFSDSYFGAAQYVVVKSDNTAFDACTTKEEVDAVLKTLSGKASAQQGTTGYFYISGSEDFNFEGISNLTATAFDSAVQAAQDVANGSSVVAILDDEVAKKVAQNNSGVKIIEIALSSEEYGIGVNKNNKDLLEVVNTVLKNLKDSGELADIIAKHTGN